ncbi:MAG: hypothetical protein WC533_01135 [Candidatus Pacearchaeota archaeon]
MRGNIPKGVLAFSVFFIFAISLVSASIIYVPENFSKIQDAVNNSTNGDTIIVRAGTYVENQIVIDKSINLIGENKNETIIDGSSALLSSTGLIQITANGSVIFSNFSLRNAGGASNGGDGNDGRTNVGIYTQSAYDSAVYVISEINIQGTNNPNDEEDYGFYSNSGKEQLIFTNNRIRGTGANPILLEKHTGDTEISYNNLDAGIYGVDSIFIMTYGETDITSLQKISNNHFDMSSGESYDYNHRSTAITIASSYPGNGNGKFTDVEISNNIIEKLKSNRRGIGFWNGAVDDGNEGASSGIISNNTITGENADGSRGISILGKTTNINIVNNKIEKIETGIWSTNWNSAFSTNTLINYNKFINNNYSLKWDGAVLLNAENNYWGKCSGPSGNDSAGNIDFTPWLGICITNMDSPTCAIQGEEIILSSTINGSYFLSAVFSFNNGTSWINKTGELKTQNQAEAVINSSELACGQNIAWYVTIEDLYGNKEKSREESFYIMQETNLHVNPSAPDGLNGWYINNPVFSLFSDLSALQIFYKWDGLGPFEYTAPFGLENAPNNGNISGGVLQIKYWSNFTCKSEEMLNKTFYFDFTNPVITSLTPDNQSVIYNSLKPEISAFLDEVYGSNSGIDKNSIIMKVDGTDVTSSALITGMNNLDADITYTPSSDLSLGNHEIFIYVKDNAGRESELNWTFNISLNPLFTIKINSPQNKIYNSKRILFDISSTDNVDFKYINHNDITPRWKTLCVNCNEYNKTRTLKEGWNNITIRATDSLGQTEEENITLFIDSKKPVILKTMPIRNSVTNGSRFYLKYNEENLAGITLFYGNESTSLKNCSSGKNRECSTSADLSKYNNKWVKYYFNASDSINSAQSKETAVFVDAVSPTLTVYYPKNENYGRKVAFNLTANENVKLEYYDNSAYSPRWRTLCVNCDEYGLSRVKTRLFSAGTYRVIIRAVDDAGNSDEEEVEISVVY